MWLSESMGWSATAFLLGLLLHVGCLASISIFEVSKQVLRPRVCDLQIQGIPARISQAVLYSPIRASGKGLDFLHHQAHKKFSKHEMGLGVGVGDI